MNKIYYAKISDEIVPDMFNKLLNLVSTQEREKITRLRFDSDKMLSLYARVLLRAVVYQTQNISNTEILISENEYGKPFLKNNKDFHFNISHTKNAVVLVVYDSCVGVDIERVRPINTNVARRFFTKTELEYVVKTNCDRRFCEVWTKKESYVKFKGRGIGLGLDRFDVLSDELSKNFSFFKQDNYFISVYSEGLSKNNNLVSLSQEDIEKMANLNLQLTN
ncbi:MAG: 4'-phosphopantetheinyl transferase superfamily protein [Oscillospiraceae bacterium]